MKLSLIFSGQGSQYTGMGKDFYEQYAVAREVFEEAGDILGVDFESRCFKGHETTSLSTHHNQVNVFVTSVAMYRVYQYEIGLMPDFCAGHSLGEYSALCCAGAIHFPDALRLVEARGKIMQEVQDTNDDIMAAVYGMKKAELEELCSRVSTDGHMAVVSNDNSDKQLVLSGHRDIVDSLRQTIEDQGYKVVPLKVKAAFHSPLFSSVTDRFRQLLKGYSFQTTGVPVVSNTTAKPHSGEILQYLSEHITKPVRWRESLEFMVHNGVDGFIEIGPGHSLSRLLQDHTWSIPAFAYDDPRDRKACSNWLDRNRTYSKNNILSHMKMCLKHAVCTQNHNWDEDEYRAGVVVPYQKMVGMLHDVENNRALATKSRYAKMVELVREIWNTKKVPQDEQTMRIAQLNDGLEEMTGMN